MSLIFLCGESGRARFSQTGDCAAIVTTAVTRCNSNTLACFFAVETYSSSLVLAINDYITDASSGDVAHAFLCRLASPAGASQLATSDAHTRQFKVAHVELTGRGPAVAVCVLPPPGTVSDGAAHCSDCAIVASADGAVSVFSINTGELLAVMNCVRAHEISPLVTAPSTTDVPAGADVEAIAAVRAVPRADDAARDSVVCTVVAGVAAPAGSAVGAAPGAGSAVPAARGIASTEPRDVATKTFATRPVVKGILHCDGKCAVLAFAQGDA